MAEGTDKGALAVEAQIACRPDTGRTDVGGKDGILSSHLVQRGSDKLRVQRRRAGLAHGIAVEVFARALVVLQRILQMGAVRFLFQQREECRHSFFCRPDQPDIDRAAAADLGAAFVDLNLLRLRRIELRIWKVGADREQHIAVLHGAVAGGKSEQASHPDVERIVVLHELLTAKRVHDRCLQRAGKLHQLPMRPTAARAGKDGDAFRSIEQRGSCVQLRRCRQDGGVVAEKAKSDRLGCGMFESHIARDHHHGNAAFRDSSPHGDRKDTRHVRRFGHSADVHAALREDLLGMRLLEVLRTDFAAWDLRGDGKHGNPRALAVVEAVDEMQVAGSAAAEHYRELIGKVRVGSRGKGGRLFMPHVNPSHLRMLSQRIGDGVSGVARQPINALDSSLRQCFYQYLCDIHGLSSARIRYMGKGPHQA